MKYYYGQIFMFPILLNQVIGKDFSPIIMIPGYSGSQMEVKLDHKKEKPNIFCATNTKDFFNIWVNLELFVPFAKECLADNLRMVYDKATHSTHSPQGVVTRIPNFGDTSSIEYINPNKMKSTKYYLDLANALVDQKGYVRNVNLSGAPYDFRRAPNDNRQWFVDMKSLTERSYGANGGRRVILISHSMGALMVLKFLQEQTQEWKDKHISAHISLAGAYGGTAKAVKLYAVGDDLGVYVVNALQQREIQMTWSSVAYLMPSPQVWPDFYTLARAYNKKYTVANIPDFFANLSCSDCFDMWNDTEPFKDRFTHPGVDVYCLYGKGTDTVEELVNDSGEPGHPEIYYGEGDGTINLRSLEACLRWNSTKNHTFFSKLYNNVNHLQILTDNTVIQDVVSIVERLN